MSTRAALAYLPAPWSYIVTALIGLLAVVRLGRLLTHQGTGLFIDVVQGFRRARSAWRERNDDP